MSPHLCSKVVSVSFLLVKGRWLYLFTRSGAKCSCLLPTSTAAPFTSTVGSTLYIAFFAFLFFHLAAAGSGDIWSSLQLVFA